MRSPSVITFEKVQLSLFWGLGLCVNGALAHFGCKKVMIVNVLLIMQVPVSMVYH